MINHKNLQKYLVYTPILLRIKKLNLNMKVYKKKKKLFLKNKKKKNLQKLRGKIEFYKNNLKKF